MGITVQIFRIAAVIFLAVVSTSAIHAQSFSLDNNPAAPIGGDPPGVIPGFGAEDPFGLGLVGGGLAPSPTLGLLPTSDGAILSPGPVVQHPGPNGSYMSSISVRKAAGFNPRLLFSIDRVSVGIPGSAAFTESTFMQAPSDIYASTTRFLDPGLLAGTLVPGFNGLLASAGVGGSNLLNTDDSALGLLSGGGVVPPGVPAPPIVPGSHDNVDGFDTVPVDSNGNLLFDNPGYFSIYPDEAVVVGTSAADLFAVAQGDVGAIAVPYAAALSMFLDTGGINTDAIDALALFDNRLQPISVGMPGAPGAIEPGIDFALFSLAPGSASLGIFGLSPADILFTDFTGAFGIYALSTDIGLFPQDNVDALTIIPEPSGVLLGVMALCGLAARRRKRT